MPSDWMKSIFETVSIILIICDSRDVNFTAGDLYITRYSLSSLAVLEIS